MILLVLAFVCVTAMAFAIVIDNAVLAAIFAAWAICLIWERSTRVGQG